MRNRDIVSSLFWMGVGSLFIAGSFMQGLFREGVPGAGFLPLLTGISLAVLGCMVFIPALTKKGATGPAKVEKFFPEENSLKKILLALAALLIYGASLQYSGYLINTFLLMFLLSRLIEPKRWGTVLMVALCTTGFSYLVLVVLLEVQLPKGILAF